MAEKKWREPVQIDTDQTHQTDTSKEDIGLTREDIKRSLQTDLAKDAGKHFRQTPIEITRKILARITLGFRPDRHQHVPPNRQWQKKNGEN